MKPIGFWLRRADELLTQRIDEAQRSNGLTRLEWQALSVIREQGAPNRYQIAAALRPFVEPPALYSLLADLVERGWISGSDSQGYALTADGQMRYEQALAAQQAIRQRAVEGISQDAYQATVRVLEQLVKNLEEA